VFLYQEVKSILIHELPPAKPRTANGFAPKAYMVGRCIGSLAAVVFLICDGNVPGRNITIYEAMPVLGGSLDGDGNPTQGYTMRGGRMLTTDNYLTFPVKSEKS
jgi:oleate hydratase